MTLSLETVFSSLNSSKYFSGIMMILLNIGGKQISNEISSAQENILNHIIIRRLLVFVVVFVATKDVKISLIVTICFIVIVTGFFNEDSKYCVLPEKYKQMSKAMDTNKDGVVSQSEIDNAISVLEKAKRQDNLNNQMNMMNSLEHNNTEV